MVRSKIWAVSASVLMIFAGAPPTRADMAPSVPTLISRTLSPMVAPLPPMPAAPTQNATEITSSASGNLTILAGAVTVEAPPLNSGLFMAPPPRDVALFLHVDGSAPTAGTEFRVTLQGQTQRAVVDGSGNLTLTFPRVERVGMHAEVQRLPDGFPGLLSVSPDATRVEAVVTLR